MYCTEQNFGVIASIEMFDLANMSPSQNLYLPKRYFSFSDQISISSISAVPMYPKSASLSETAVSGRGGSGYEVSLSWQVKRPEESDFDMLETLKNNTKCLKITAFGGAVAYILADESHYQFSYQRSGEMVDCALKVYNINGIQQVVS